jgi:hypothetical protein
MRPIMIILLIAASVTALAAVMLNSPSEPKPGGGSAATTKSPEDAGALWTMTGDLVSRIAKSAREEGRKVAEKGADALGAANREMEGTQAAIAKQSNAPGETEPRPDRLPKIPFPDPVEGVQFGMGAETIQNHFDIDWRRQSKGQLMLAHSIRDGVMARFHFSRAAGLQKLEMHYQTDRKRLPQLYRRIRTDYHELYGALPGSARTRWTDGQTRVRITRDEQKVALIFVPHR